MRAIVFVGVLSALAAASAGPARPEPELTFPLIKGHGGEVHRPDAAQPPRKGVKVVFDVTADANSDGVNKGLDRVARYLNLSAAHGVETADVKVALVLHGEATKAALSDAAYATRFGGKGNPNLPLIRDLKRHGVEVFVCGQSLASKKFPAETVSGEASIAAAAMTVLANKQADGYAYLPAH